MKLNEIKQLNESKFLTNEEEIIQWLIDNKILGTKVRERERVSFLPGGIINFNNSMERSAYNSPDKIKELKVQFNICDGRFNMGHNDLDSFDGFPHTVVNECIVTGNPRITSLVGCPPICHNSLEIAGTGITSLVGIADHVKKARWIGASFYEITEGGIGLILIEGLKSIVTGYKEDSILPKPFQIIEKYLGKPEDLFECQAELIEAGYDQFAIL